MEPNPTRRLIAHYDGFPTPTIEECLHRVGIAVTCTGRPGSITLSMLKAARDGLVLINAGHGDDEIDVAAIKANATAGDEVSDHVVRYSLENGPKVVLLANGHPLNIVTNSGSPEPVLLHFALLGLTLEWLAGNPIEPGECRIPEGLEERAAELALQALGTAHG